METLDKHPPDPPNCEQSDHRQQTEAAAQHEVDDIPAIGQICAGVASLISFKATIINDRRTVRSHELLQNTPLAYCSVYQPFERSIMFRYGKATNAGQRYQNLPGQPLHPPRKNDTDIRPIPVGRGKLNAASCECLAVARTRYPQSLQRHRFLW